MIIKNDTKEIISANYKKILIDVVSVMNGNNILAYYKIYLKITEGFQIKFVLENIGQEDKEFDLSEYVMLEIADYIMKRIENGDSI